MQRAAPIPSAAGTLLMPPSSSRSLVHRRTAIRHFPCMKGSRALHRADDLRRLPVRRRMRLRRVPPLRRPGQAVDWRPCASARRSAGQVGPDQRPSMHALHRRVDSGHVGTAAARIDRVDRVDRSRRLFTPSRGRRNACSTSSYAVIGYEPQRHRAAHRSRTCRSRPSRNKPYRHRRVRCKRESMHIDKIMDRWLLSSVHQRYRRGVSCDNVVSAVCMAIERNHARSQPNRPAGTAPRVARLRAIFPADARASQWPSTCRPRDDFLRPSVPSCSCPPDRREGSGMHVKLSAKGSPIVHMQVLARLIAIERNVDTRQVRKLSPVHGMTPTADWSRNAEAGFRREV